MRKSMLAFAVFALIACLSGVTILSLSDVNSRNDGLNTNLSNLQEAYDSLQTQYYALLGNHSVLEYDYQNILLQNPYALVPNPGASPVPDTQQMLARYQALQQLYIRLLTEYNEYKDSYQRLKTMTDQRLMDGNLRSLINPDDPDVITLTQSLTGKPDNKSAPDPEKYWEDITKIYNWVKENIEYREDGLFPELPSNPSDPSFEELQMTDQMAQKPNETLSLRMGDCEDYAALITSMIRAYFNKTYLVESIWITGENAGHVAVVIPFQRDQIAIIDPIRNYYSHDTLGNMGYNSISSEIYNWMNIWRPSLGNDVHVYRVFSDYMDKFFDGTEEYINWMYNR
jgi:transglutaminase-like putative cysteine protease